MYVQPYILLQRPHRTHLEVVDPINRNEIKYLIALLQTGISGKSDHSITQSSAYFKFHDHEEFNSREFQDGFMN